MNVQVLLNPQTFPFVQVSKTFPGTLFDTDCGIHFFYLKTETNIKINARQFLNTSIIHGLTKSVRQRESNSRA